MKNSILASFFVFFCVFTLRRTTCLKMEIYYETYSPDSNTFFQNQLIETWKFMQQFVLEDNPQYFYLELSLYPFAKAIKKHTKNGTIVECQNGGEECYLDTINACEMTLTGFDRADLWLPWIACTLQKQKNWNECEQISIASAEFLEKLKFCAEGKEGKRLQQKLVELTPSNVLSVPWIIINDVEVSQEAKKDLRSTICKHLGNEPIPFSMSEWCTNNNNAKKFEIQNNDKNQYVAPLRDNKMYNDKITKLRKKMKENITQSANSNEKKKEHTSGIINNIANNYDDINSDSIRHAEM